MTAASVESIISGTFTCRVSEGHEAVHVGRLVPVGVGQADVEHLGAALTWARPTSAASSNRSCDDQFLEAARPDHVGPLAHEDGPVVVGRVQHLDPADRDGALRRRPAGRPAPHQPAMARMCAGVVPQHPPTRLTHPSSTKRCSFSARLSGVSPYCPRSSGRPGVGVDADEVRAQCSPSVRR